MLVGTGGTVAAAHPDGAGASSARGGVVSLCSGSGWQERRGLEALESLKAGTSAFRIVFRAERPDYYAMTRARSRTIEIYVRSCTEQSRELLRHVVAP